MIVTEKRQEVRADADQHDLRGGWGRDLEIDPNAGALDLEIDPNTGPLDLEIDPNAGALDLEIGDEWDLDLEPGSELNLDELGLEGPSPGRWEFTLEFTPDQYADVQDAIDLALDMGLGHDPAGDRTGSHRIANVVAYLLREWASQQERPIMTREESLARVARWRKMVKRSK